MPATIITHVIADIFVCCVGGAGAGRVGNTRGFTSVAYPTEIAVFSNIMNGVVFASTKINILTSAAGVFIACPYRYANTTATTLVNPGTTGFRQITDIRIFVGGAGAGRVGSTIVLTSAAGRI
jgi:hypothetical protein